MSGGCEQRSREGELRCCLVSVRKVEAWPDDVVALARTCVSWQEVGYGCPTLCTASTMYVVS